MVDESHPRRMEILVRTLGRMTIAGAAALALLLAPVGIAAAQTATMAPADHRDNGPSVTLTTEQRTAVVGARKMYIKTATDIRKAYRQTVAGLLEGVQTATADAELAYVQARDAYVVVRATGGSDAEIAQAKTDAENAGAALKSARDAAKAKVQGQLDDAKAKARADLDAAKAAYVTTVKGAVPDAPAWLLVPPGGGKGWFGHGFGSDSRMGMGMHR